MTANELYNRLGDYLTSGNVDVMIQDKEGNWFNLAHMVKIYDERDEYIVLTMGASYE